MTEFVRLAAEILFVFSVVFIWTMLLYQFVLTIGGFLWRAAWSREVERRPAPPAEWPGVSILVPARNEEKVIDGLLDHLQRLDYPRDRLEIIVINDGSTDRTASLVRLGPERLPAASGCSRIPTGGGRPGQERRPEQRPGCRRPPFDRHLRRRQPSGAGLPEDPLPGAGRRIPRWAAVTGKFRAYNKDRTLPDPA